jgi:hypothetical protein
MPYAPWVLDTFAAYSTPVLHPDAMPPDWDELFDTRPPLTWDDLEKLLTAAKTTQVSWAQQLLIWPDATDPRNALITYDLPDGTRRASLAEDIEYFQPPSEHATWADAICWGLQAVREVGERMVRIDLALHRLATEAAASVTAWESERTHLLTDRGLEAGDQPEDASFLDDAIRPYEKDAMSVLHVLAALVAGRCPVCQLSDCDTVGDQPVTRCRCGKLHTSHEPSGDCTQFRAVVVPVRLNDRAGE